MVRIFISTGEVSGDLQGALLIQALYQHAQSQGIDLEILALGGDRMAAAGATLLGKTTEIGSIGLVEAFSFVKPTWQVQQRAKAYLKANPPDLLILIDYMGPNVAIGNYGRKHFPNVPIIYYIAPQAWVWSPNEQNTQKIINISDHILAIFPQEAEFYRQKGASVSWVGHPLLDRIAQAPNKEEARKLLGISPEQIIITLLPASRKQELKYLLPTMGEAARKLQEKIPDVQFLIPVSLPIYREAIAAIVKEYGLRAHLLESQTLEAIAAADLALTKSGTVNLEIALLNVPQIVMYRVSASTIWLARKLLNFSIDFMSPVNLVVEREIVPELLQEKAIPETIVREGMELLFNSQRREQVLKDYREMREKLGDLGVCERAATKIFRLLPLG
jgi:lipid-A-disaccharide synthase